jgi:hypothetical protein
MSRACIICSDQRLAAQVQSLVLAGVADREIGRRLSLDKGAVNRHKLLHILEPLRHQLAIAGRDSEPQRERKKLATAAKASSEISTPDLVEAVLGLRAQLGRMVSIEARLERAATAAEAQGAFPAVAQVASQQLRAVELGGKIAGLPGLVPQRLVGDVVPGTTFEVNIHLGGHVETISMSTPATTHPVIDADPEDQAANGPVDFDALANE